MSSRQRGDEMKMVSVKISDLTGPALDWAVAVATGLQPISFKIGGKVTIRRSISDSREFSPSTNWSQGGPLIEERGIAIVVDKFFGHGPVIFAGQSEEFSTDGTIEVKCGWHEGPTYLIAGMRCLLASTLASDRWNIPPVEVPAELIG